MIIKRIIHFVFPGLLLLSSNTFSGWIPYYTGIQVSYNSIHFVNSQTGFCVGWYGTIVKTVNGGVNWTAQSSGTNYKLNCIFFINENTGFAGGDDNQNLNSVLIKTTDGGNSWNSINTGFSFYSFEDIFFVSSMTGYVSGANYDSLRIIKTTDGGITWSQSYYAYYGISSIDFISSSTGFATYGQGILKTTNAGVNWNLYYIPQFWGYSVKFHDLTNGYCVGFQGGFPNGITRIFKTINSGQNWFEQYANPTPTGLPTDLFLVNKDTAYFTKPNQIYKTSNGGNNWFINLQGYNPSCIFFVNSFTGYAGCLNNGMVLKTTDGGEPIGIQPISNETPNSFSLSQNYPNPFNPVTKIKFQIAKSCDAKLKVYDVMGREIETLINRQLSPRTYEAEWDASNYPSGVYFYRLTAGDYSDTKRMVLIK